MKRRFNHTGRKRIEQSSCAINVVDGKDGVQSFSASINLDGLGLPGNSRVYIEAYVKNSSMRFDLGTVSEMRLGDIHELTEMDVGGAVLFRVRVVDESELVGKILASANRLRPSGDQHPEGRRAILPIRSTDLGSEVWKLEIDVDTGPVLCVSNRLPGLKDQVKSDPLYAALILPHVVRMVVMNIVSNRSIDVEDWTGDWSTWVHAEFGLDLAVMIEDEQAVDDLGDEVASSFAMRHDFLNKLLASRETE